MQSILKFLFYTNIQVAGTEISGKSSQVEKVYILIKVLPKSLKFYQSLTYTVPSKSPINLNPNTAQKNSIKKLSNTVYIKYEVESIKQ